MNSADVALIIDDDPDICEFISSIAEDCGFAPAVVDDHTKFREEYLRCAPSIVVTDLQMPHIDGVEVLRLLAEGGSKAKIILLSGFDPKVIASAKKLGASLGLNVIGALQKPVRVGDLRNLFEHAKAVSLTPSVTELKSAIQNGALELAYQPKLTLHGEDSGSVVGFEALARWPHPRLGEISPEIFIPMAEASGLVAELTDLVLAHTLTQMARWRDAGHHFQVAVNLSARQLGDLDLPDRLARNVRESGGDPSRIILEITETGAMDDAALCMDILTRFRLKGFQLAIDDFGTGYSSLVQLYEMPFSELKIDKSFIIEVEESEQAQVIVRALVNLAHELSLSTCAEGIESAWAWNFLKSLRCEKAQGYYMSRPLRAADIPEWLESWGRSGYGKTIAADSGD